MYFSYIFENLFQIVINDVGEVLGFVDLPDLQRTSIDIFPSCLFKSFLSRNFKHGVHVIYPHIDDSVNVNLTVNKQSSEMLVTKNFANQPVV